MARPLWRPGIIVSMLLRCIRKCHNQSPRFHRGISAPLSIPDPLHRCVRTDGNGEENIRANVNRAVSRGPRFNGERFPRRFAIVSSI